MGWDIVSIGTNHQLPIHNPVETARRLLPLCDGPVSIGYFDNWQYDKDSNRIIHEWKDWIELNRLNEGLKGDLIRFEIAEYAAKLLFNNLYGDISKVKFEDEDDRELFLDSVKSKFPIFEFNGGRHHLVRNWIFEEIAEFSDNFPARWFQFVSLFRSPYEGEVKDLLDSFRNYIFKQMQLCGCDKAYYFADQGDGEMLLDKLDLKTADWLEYLYSGNFKEDKSEKPIIFSVIDYINGKIILHEDEYADCFIDDFSDMK